MAPRRNNPRVINGRMRAAKRNARSKKIKVALRRAPSSIGSYIASGVRTLTSFLPGQKVVRPTVDFILKTIGLVSAIALHNDDIIASTQIIGLTTRKILYYGDLLANCRNIGLQDLDSYGNPTLKLNFLTGRVLSMTIRVEPTAKTSERSGEWAMCLVPLKDAAVKQRYSA
ncbi:jg23699, partial [Pararge aegeria aegeria]